MGTVAKHKKKEELKMNLLFTIALYPAIISAGPTSKFINSREARSVLKKGESKGFSGWIEETFRNSNLERECIEEQCSYEEWLERAENVHSTVRKEAKLMRPTGDEKFKNMYTQCYNKIKQMELDDPSTIDFRMKCIEVFLKETFPSQFPDIVSKNDENGSVDDSESDDE